MTVLQHKRAMKALRALGRGYVVMTKDAAKAGLSTRFPVGEIVGFKDPWTVWIRKVGQIHVGRFAAGFWQPAPNKLVNRLKG